MMKNLDWSQLADRRRECRLRLFSKVVSGKVNIPKDEYLSEAPSRTRRINSQKVNHYTTKSTIFKNSFFPRTIPEWNTTPDASVDLLNAASEFTAPHLE